MKSPEERIERTNELLDLKRVLATNEGQRVIARLLAYCRVGQSIWAPGVEIHYNAGAQDVGHFLQDEIQRAKEFSK